MLFGAELVDSNDITLDPCLRPVISDYISLTLKNKCLCGQEAVRN